MEEEEKQLGDMSLAELGRIIQAKPEIIESITRQQGEKPVDVVRVAAFQSSI